MKTAYLRNGEVVELHNTLDTGEFVIEKMCVYFDYEGNEEAELCGVKEVVKEVFMKPPIEKKHDDLIKIIEKTETKSKELAEIERQIQIALRELRQSAETKTDLQKQIINRSELLNAKKITVFSEFKPYTLEENEEKRSLRLTYTIDVWKGKFNAWVYNIYSDGTDGCSNNINPKYGLLVDVTDEEVLETGKQIVKDAGEISDWDLERRIPDEYLTPELLARKEQILKNKKQNEIKTLEEKIKGEQQELRTLKTK